MAAKKTTKKTTRKQESDTSEVAVACVVLERTKFKNMWLAKGWSGSMPEKQAEVLAKQGTLKIVGVA